MSFVLRTAAILAATAAALTGVVATPAHATDPSMRISFCNRRTSQDVQITSVFGTNQNGSTGSYDLHGWNLKPNQCRPLDGHWWALETQVQVNAAKDCWRTTVWGKNGTTMYWFIG